MIKKSTPKTIRKILIANRGEIAVRIMRTCKEMGIRTVAVYSAADRHAVFVAMADEAYAIGPAEASASYLCADKIVAVAQASGADAIHPGYGFLSEKAHFAELCSEAGLIFIGPDAKAIAQMGDKLAARAIAKKANVPMVPGTTEPIADAKVAEAFCAQHGYPVLLKALSGGGGKGMRVVSNAHEFTEAFARATSEARKSFGDARVFLEKYVEKPRHVETQILSDAHGQHFFLGERECSTQRRHQKIIEEAPCAYLREDVRHKMQKASLNLAKAVNYLGVGTIEYLVDAKQNFYFLEMNTRLQVEHTVTEAVFGLDLVRLQIEVAQGEKLTLQQDQLKPRGHAIQCRIYAEDPSDNFKPCPGRVEFLAAPEGLGVRHDCGVRQNSTISIDYDPMIAKLICADATRDLAIAKMVAALGDYCLLGIDSNLAFLKMLMASAEFKQQMIHTQYLDQNLADMLSHLPALDVPDVVKVAAALRLMSTRPATEQASSTWWQDGLHRQLRGKLL